MHKNFQFFFLCLPHLSGSKFPCDSRGGLRLAVGCREVGLLDQNVKHTIKKSSFFFADRLVVTGERNSAALLENTPSSYQGCPIPTIPIPPYPIRACRRMLYIKLRRINKIQKGYDF